jgi:DNA-binding NarL/FixJ family response regulator
MAPMAIMVAIVEDDARIRDAFAEMVRSAVDLELMGAVADGAGARTLLETKGPDVLLVDLGLPDVSGIEIIRYARARHSHCAAMVVTVFGDEKNVLAAIEAGATGYLLKNAVPTDFVEQIRLLHAGGSPLSPVIARQLLMRFSNPRTPLQTTVPDADAPVLSERERVVLDYVARGFTFDEIAALLKVSRHTVTTYARRVYGKLHVGSKTEALYEARKLGLLRD